MKDEKISTKLYRNYLYLKENINCLSNDELKKLILEAPLFKMEARNQEKEGEVLRKILLSIHYFGYKEVEQIEEEKLKEELISMVSIEEAEKLLRFL